MTLSKSDKKLDERKPQEVNKMKEVLGELPVDKREVVVKKKYSLRDFLWDYPLHIIRLFKKTIPLSYILTFLCIGALLIFFLKSDIVAKALEDTGNKNTFTEGSVGAISSFNPFFSSTNSIDRSVKDLVFQKFIDLDSNGDPIASIAKSWESSSNGLQYDFTIREDILWQDGTKLTIDDVLFTFQTAIDLAKDSSKNSDSIGTPLVDVEVSKISENQIRFKLPEINPIFIEAISQYIIPTERTKDIDISEIRFDTQLVQTPLGSGKYMIVRTEQNAIYLEDNQHDQYNPQVKNIVLKVFPDNSSLEMAFRIGALDAIGGWDEYGLTFANEYTHYTKKEIVEQNRNKWIFFNLRKESLSNKNIRLGLIHLINKEELLNQSNIRGVIMKGPINENSWAFNDNISYPSYDPSKAAEYLSSAGYTKNEDGFFKTKDDIILSFSISYFDNPINERLITALEEMLKKEGVVLKTEKLNFTQITQGIIATRDFELLLYEIESTVDPDQYSIWHSLKTNYPDLNISGYSYDRADIMLEQGRKVYDKTKRREKYLLLQKYIANDSPAIFLYNPIFSYIISSKISNVDFSGVLYSSDRFRNIEDWIITR